MKILAVMVPFNLLDCARRLHRALEERGHALTVLTCSTGMELGCRFAGIPVVNANRERDREPAVARGNVDAALLSRKCAVHGIDYDQVRFPQEHRWRRPEDHTRRTLLAAILLLERLRDELAPALYVCLDYSLLDLVADRVLRRAGIPLVYSRQFMLAGHAFWNRELDIWSWIDARMLARDPTPDERVRAEEYLADQVRGRRVLGIDHFARSLFAPGRVWNVLVHTAEWLLSRCDTSWMSPGYYVWGFLEPYWIRGAKRRLCRPFDAGAGPFVFFPLQVRDDATLTVLAREHFFQHRTVRSVADALPAGYRLVVKDHPHPIWPVPVEWFEAIARHPRVTIVPTETSVHNILPASAAVCTINSDVGWEALAYRKPVVVLSRSYYSHRGLTVDVGAPGELHRALASALDPGYRVDERVLLRLVNAFLGSHGPRPFFDDPADAGAFADEMLKRYGLPRVRAAPDG
jgi:hypothetical protein